MIAGRDLLKRVKAGIKRREKEGAAAPKCGHAKSCRRNFDYADISKGDPRVLKLAIREVKAMATK